MKSPNAAASDQFAFIDALRGFAAVTVFFFHAILHVWWGYPAKHITPGSFTWHFIHHDFNWGRYAVSVFFLVSGFLIPSTLRRPGMTLRTFTIHRVFRLYPAYWFSIILFAACNALATGDPGTPWPTLLANLTEAQKFFGVPGFLFAACNALVTGDVGAPWTTVLVNLTMLQGFFGVPDFIGAFWTLQIELVFYGLCGLFFALGVLDRRRTGLVLACLAMMAMAWLRLATGLSLPVAMPLALSLMALADLIRAYDQRLCSRAGLAGWTALTCVCLTPACLWAYDDFGWGAVLSNWAAVATFLVCYACRDVFSRVTPLRRVGKYFGDISYSFYLLHSAVGLELAKWAYRETGSFALTLVVGFAAVTLVSALAYRCVEVPGIRMGRSLAAQRRSAFPG